MSITCLIFDLDGVLVETADLHHNAWREAALEFGAEPGVFETLDFRGVRREDCLGLIFTDKQLSEEQRSIIQAKKDELYRCAIAKRGAGICVEGVAKLLVQLGEQGYKLAIASASRNADLILEMTNLKKLVHFVCDGNQVHESGLCIRPKPAPDQFLCAADKLNTAPEQCVVFEDANVGVEGALAAGMCVIGVGPTVANRNDLHAKFKTLANVNFKALDSVLTTLPPETIRPSIAPKSPSAPCAVASERVT